MSQKFITFTPKTNADITLLPFNRKVVDTSNLEEKIAKYGWQGTIQLIETDLISGKKEIYVADGHHRLTAARNLKINFDAVLSPIVFTSISELVLYVASLNNTQKAWLTQDYVSAYCFLQNPEYLKLQKYTEASMYSLPTVALLGTQYKNNTSVKSLLSSGNYKMTNEKNIIYITQLSQKLAKYRRPTNRHILAINCTCNTDAWNEAKFITKWIENYRTLPNMETLDTIQVFNKWLES